MAGKPTTIAFKAVAQDRASAGLKLLTKNVNQVAKGLVSADKKVVAQNLKSNASSKKKISASKRVEFALKKQAAGSDKTARKILALNIKYERSRVKMLALARAGKPIPANLARQAVASKKAAAALGKHASRADRLRKAFKGLGKGLLIGGGIAATAGSIFLLMRGFRLLRRAIVDSVKKSMEFETSLNEVMTIADKAEFSLDGVKKETLGLAAAFATSPVEQARGLYTAISGGANTAQKATELMTAANRLAISGVTDIETAVNGLVNITNVYADAGYDAARSADIFQAGIRQGKTTAAELSTELGQVAGIAKAAGMSLEEVVAAVATITTKGVTTSMAVTQLRSALVALSKGASKSSKEAERLFGEKGAFSQAAMNAAGGFIPFLRKINASTKLNEQSLVKLMGRVEGVNAILNLVVTDGGAKYDESLNTIVSSHGDVEQAMQIMQATFAHQIKRSDSLRESLSITFGDAVTGSEAARDSVIEVNEFMGEMITIFQSPEGRAAINQMFKTLASGASVSILALEYVIEQLEGIESRFNDIITMGGLIGEQDIFTAMPLDAAHGYDKFSDALAKLRVNLEGVGDTSKRRTDEERKAAADINKAYQKSYAATIEARRRKAAAVRDQANREALAEKDAARKIKEEKKKAVKEEKDRLDEIEALWKQHLREKESKIKASLKKRRDYEKQVFEQMHENHRTHLDRELDGLEKLDQKISDRSQAMQDAFFSAAAAMQEAWSTAFEDVGRLVNETEREIVRNEEGLLEEREKIVGQHIKTSSEAFAEFTSSVGKMILAEIGKYIVALGVKMLADRVAAMFSIGNSAAEAAGKQMSAHAWIPFVGIAVGLAAAGAIAAATIGIRDDVGSVPSLPQPKGMAAGGFVSGPAGRDRVPAWLTAGEFVIPRGTVDQIRRGQGPSTPGHYADGGLVAGAQSAAPAMNITIASAIPQDRAQIRRMVRDVIVPELRQLARMGAY